MPKKNCADYCAGRLRGIVENQKLLGVLPKDFAVDVRPMRGMGFARRGAYILTCEHGQSFLFQRARKAAK